MPSGQCFDACDACAMTTIVRKDGGSYRVQALLGSGSFGSVYRCVRNDASGAQRRCALKFLRTRDDARLREECTLLQEHSHGSIVQVVEWMEAEDVGYSDERLKRKGSAIVLELASSDLATELSNSASTPVHPDLALSWATDVGAALRHLHEREVIHRDVKPGNILLFWDLQSASPGGFMRTRAKLGDFGSTRVLPKTSKRPRLNHKEQCTVLQRPWYTESRMTKNVCTAWYRAPELLVHTGGVEFLDAYSSGRSDPECPYGLPVDVWSFGSVVYELLAGKPLARADTGVGVVACWVDVLGRPCFDAGYAQNPRWIELVGLAEGHRGRRRRLESAPCWDVVAACMAWQPERRLPIRKVCEMPWFTSSVGPAASTATCAPPSCFDAEAPDAEAPETTPEPQRVCWPASVRKILGDANPPPSPCFDAGRQTCACSGNCQSFKHRTESKCDCATLVQGSKYCIECVCRVAGCTKPKQKSEFCHRHRRLIDGTPLAVRLAVRNADLAGDLVPCDVVDFLKKEAIVLRRRDLAASILIAMLKEPRATDEFLKQWRTFPPDYSGGQLHAGLKAVIEVCASTPDQNAPHAVELQQLSRRGVARFLGTIAVACAFGVVCRADEGEAAGFCLGMTRIRYKWAAVEPVAATKFLEIVRDFSIRDEASLFPPCFDAGAQRTVSDLVAFSESFGAALQAVGRDIPSLKLGGSYVRDSIVRKHVVARQSGVTGWEQCSVPMLQKLSVDRCAFLECFDASTSAAEVSLLVCGRPHWPTFVSMFTCLWNEVADTVPGAEAAIAKARRTGQDRKALEEFRSEHGFSPHPYTLVSKLCFDAN